MRLEILIEANKTAAAATATTVTEHEN